MFHLAETHHLFMDSTQWMKGVHKFGHLIVKEQRDMLWKHFIVPFQELNALFKSLLHLVRPDTDDEH